MKSSASPTEIRSGPPLRFTDTQASVLLDLVRGLAAIVVLLEHWHHIFFIDFGQVTLHRKLLAIPYLLTSAGHQAVVIFFVLSGYLISGSVFRMFRAGKWSWETYSLHRIVRLWIVLIPALLLTALCDQVGMHLHRASAIALYTGQSGNHIIRDVVSNSHGITFLGNLVFLQNIATSTFGSNGALWSLANEFWYYVLFPLAFIALRPGAKLPTRLVQGALCIVIAYFLRGSIIQLFPVWLLGTLLVVLPVKKISSYWRWISAIAYFCIFYFFSKSTKLSGTYSDWLLGIATTAFLWILISAGSQRSTNSALTRGTRTLARFSYTLYLVHLPVLVLLAALLLGSSRWPSDLVHTLEGFGILLFVIGLAYTIATVTEFRTDSFRSWIERRLAVPAPAGSVHAPGIDKL